jgi:predicted nuclease of predicted toxin-antitoxin system
VKFKVDENLPADAALIIRAAGFPADTVEDEGLTGSDDLHLAQVVRDQRRVLLTLDNDFGNIRAHPPNEYPGILILGPQSQDKPATLALLKRLLIVLREKDPVGQLWIVESDRIRYRQS